MPEPTVLDYVKAKLMPWRGPVPEIGPLPADSKVKRSASRIPNVASSEAALDLAALPWRTPLAFLLIIFAQYFWAPENGSWQAGLPIAFAALGLAIWALSKGEWRIPDFEQGVPQSHPIKLRTSSLLMSLGAFILAFIGSGGNRFSFLGVTFWLSSVALLLISFWQASPKTKPFWPRFRDRALAKDWTLRLPRFTLMVLLVSGIIIFFRASQISAVPFEMVSDHMEKLLDVMDIQNGQNSIFFLRNTGREPIQFYLTAAIADGLGTGISFLSLKIGMITVGLLSLVYSYLLGKEFGGRWVGLLALLLTGVAYWPNVLARVGLRFILYPALAAPAIYYFLRGLRTGRLNPYLLSGLFLGAGFYGYTAFRIMPFVLLTALALFFVHEKEDERQRNALAGAVILTLVAFLVLTPLLRYSLEPDSLFNFRASTRLLTDEGRLPGNAGTLFLFNLWRAVIMPVYSGGNTWLVGLTQQPALDVVSGALYLVGVFLVGLRYVRTRHWQDLFLLLAVPLLMLPSVLSLAFPGENPIMNRTGAALVPIFVICAFGLDALLHGLKDKLGGLNGQRVAQGFGLLILLFCAGLNYDLAFHQYPKQVAEHTWNSSEMGEIIGAFTRSVGNQDSAWVVPYPYWVDTRLVALHAGQPGNDLALWPDQFDQSIGSSYPKLFILNLNDAEGLAALQAIYPNGEQSLREGNLPGKEFLIYFVGSGG